MAGAPMRTPPGARALTSPTTAFLFSVMWTRSHAFSILFPLMPCTCVICLSNLHDSFLTAELLWRRWSCARAHAHEGCRRKDTLSCDAPVLDILLPCGTGKQRHVTIDSSFTGKADAVNKLHLSPSYSVFTVSPRDIWCHADCLAFWPTTLTQESGHTSGRRSQSTRWLSVPPVTSL